MFCYVNSVFAPGLDEGVGGLWRVSFLFSFFCWYGCMWGGRGRGRRGEIEGGIREERGRERV